MSLIDSTVFFTFDIWEFLQNKLTVLVADHITLTSLLFLIILI